MSTNKGGLWRFPNCWGKREGEAKIQRGKIVQCRWIRARASPPNPRKEAAAPPSARREKGEIKVAEEGSKRSALSRAAREREGTGVRGLPSSPDEKKKKETGGGGRLFTRVPGGHSSPSFSPDEKREEK